MLPGHLFGATGAGDVKLFAAAGALIGPAPIVDGIFLHGARRRRDWRWCVAHRRQRLRQTLGGTARLDRDGRGERHGD